MNLVDLFNLDTNYNSTENGVFVGITKCTQIS